MPPRIGPRKPVRVYLAQWRNHIGLTGEEVAELIGVDKGTVSRWETGERQPSYNSVAAYAEALGIEMTKLSHPPSKRPSVDAVIDKLPAEAQKQVIEIIETFIKRAS